MGRSAMGISKWSDEVEVFELASGTRDGRQDEDPFIGCSHLETGRLDDMLRRFGTRLECDQRIAMRLEGEPLYHQQLVNLSRRLASENG